VLQCPAEADGLFRSATKGVCPGKLVLLGSLGLDVTGITFYAHPPKGTLECYQSILPCGDGSFPAFKLPLPGKELLLQLDGHCRRCHLAWRRRRPTPMKKRGQHYDKRQAHAIASAN
jgi:hypothetical protein